MFVFYRLSAQRERYLRDKHQQTDMYRKALSAQVCNQHETHTHPHLYTSYTIVNRFSGNW